MIYHIQFSAWLLISNGIKRKFQNTPFLFLFKECNIKSWPMKFSSNSKKFRELQFYFFSLRVCNSILSELLQICSVLPTVIMEIIFLNFFFFVFFFRQDNSRQDLDWLTSFVSTAVRIVTLVTSIISPDTSSNNQVGKFQKISSIWRKKSFFSSVIFSAVCLQFQIEMTLHRLVQETI